MTVYRRSCLDDFDFVYDGGTLNISDMIKSVQFPTIPFTQGFNRELFKSSYGITPAFWRNLSIMYNLSNVGEIKKFISRNSDDLKILLLYVPIFVQREFPNDSISLELIEDHDTGKHALRAYIHTNISPSEANKKLEIIDELTFNFETDDTLDDFLLNVEFV
ncbi:hypothetical protein MBCUT_10210 [Methanobrevibacter cuticularis]|uniref:Uncharacterized protein n=1 Tax=Methanobrevibacter cuticularis TaxID=47311 RepID=A0A166E0V8_9EURY|nr:hypothetical protein [Methanobrevibacter cuticularis]KZX16155.1 hypothetical protein MBCUT_10210 [Methanobrevibacter cuticularis]